MGAIETFGFNGYMLQPASKIHASLAAKWTENDKAHKSSTPPDFWLEQGPDVESYLFTDRTGPLFFFQMRRKILKSRASIAIIPSLELHIQFGPSQEAADRDRIRKGLAEGFGWLEAAIGNRSAHLLYFNSLESNLIVFCTKRLGFKRKRTMIYKWLINPAPFEI